MSHIQTADVMDVDQCTAVCADENLRIKRLLQFSDSRKDDFLFLECYHLCIIAVGLKKSDVSDASDDDAIDGVDSKSGAFFRPNSLTSAIRRFGDAQVLRAFSSRRA